MNDHRPDGQRLAKIIARSGLASRREAERMIVAGRVKVGQKTIESPAFNVTNPDDITVDDQSLPAPQPTRLWRFHKPVGLVTSTADCRHRPTVFDSLPADLPRLISIGRLDINSEGLLLLTNDGDLKRRLEHPSNGWLRGYRVRVRGMVGERGLERLCTGVVSDGERLGPIEASVDRRLGANAWMTVALRQGRNREVRRALSVIGLDVSRLIRISFGPFSLGDLASGQVEEVPGRELRKRLGAPADIRKRGPEG